MNKMLIYDFECVVEWDAKRYRHLLDFQLPLNRKEIIGDNKKKMALQTGKSDWDQEIS